MKTYSKYKNSGIEWLQQIPEHWYVKKLKYISKVNKETMSENTDPDYEIQYVDISGVSSIYGITEMVKHRFEDAPSRARRIAKDGDVIVSTVRTYLQAITGIKNPPPNLTVSTGFAVITPSNNFDPNFASYVLKSKYFIHTVVAWSVGVSYPAINSSDISRIKIPLPPLSEQKSISSFLDRETSRIDKLIEKKQKQIELLQEKRSALISHVVTKGLDPNSKMKDSDIDWLGKIPEHWDSSSIKYLFNIQLGKMLQPDLINPDDQQVPYVKALHVHWGKVDTNDLPKMWASTRDLKQYCIKDGDLLICEGGEVGRSGIVQSPPENCIIQNAIHRVRQKQFINVKLLLYNMVVINKARWLDVLCNKATIAHLTREKLSDIKIPHPRTKEEVDLIIKYLDHETSKIDKLIDKINSSIEKLNEYRSSLISAVVTGKIDVRDEIPETSTDEQVTKIAAEFVEDYNK